MVAPWAIVPLARAPQCANEVARWLHCQWYATRGEGLAEVEARLCGQDPGRPFPSTFVGVKGQQALGTFTLESTLNPGTGWPLFCLSNLFVAEAARGQGLGQRLCEAAIVRTQQLRIPRLSLFTVSHADYYARLGWKPICQVTMNSCEGVGPATLMRLRVNLPGRIDGRGGRPICAMRRFPIGSSPDEVNFVTP